jgi:hypothetical protein
VYFRRFDLHYNLAVGVADGMLPGVIIVDRNSAIASAAARLRGKS